MSTPVLIHQNFQVYLDTTSTLQHGLPANTIKWVQSHNSELQLQCKNRVSFYQEEFSEYDNKYYLEQLCTIKKGLSRKVYCNHLTNRYVNNDWFFPTDKNMRYLILENVQVCTNFDSCTNFDYFVIIFVTILLLLLLILSFAHQWLT